MDAGQLVSGSFDNTVKLWSVADGKCERTFTGHSDWVLECEFAPHGKNLVSGSRDKTLKLWDVESGTCQATLGGHRSQINGVGFSSDGTMLVSCW
jgi:WD40 repeat protein